MSANREIDVWPVALRASSSTLNALQELLSEDELARASDFRDDDAGRAFVIARAALRVLLARKTGVNAALLRFSYNGRGKPALDPPDAVRFSVAHSGGLALVAVARGCEIGVDVELIRPLEGLLRIAEDSFCREEVTYLTSLGEAERGAAFFRIWSRKEAYVKATGEGLREPQDGACVDLRSDAGTRSLNFGGAPGRAAAWSLHDLAPVPGYAAALAYKDRARPLRVRLLVDPDCLLANKSRPPRAKRRRASTSASGRCERVSEDRA